MTLAQTFIPPPSVIFQRALQSCRSFSPQASTRSRTNTYRSTPSWSTFTTISFGSGSIVAAAICYFEESRGKTAEQQHNPISSWKPLQLGNLPTVKMSASTDFSPPAADPAKLHDDNEPKFIFFPKLPLELRDHIWEKTLSPRLVHWRPGGTKPLAVFSVNRESRAATRPKYIICHVPFLRHGYYSIFINFDIDTVYRHQNGLPNMVRQYNFPCEAIDIPDSMSTSVVVKADIFWNVQPWIRFLKTLTVNLRTAAKSNVDFSPQIHGAKQPVGHGQTIWVKIKCMCPDLEQLNVRVGKSLGKDVELEDLVELKEISYYHTLRGHDMIQDVRRQLEKVQNKGHLLGLRLRFVRQLKSGAAKKQAVSKAAAFVCTSVGASTGSSVGDSTGSGISARAHADAGTAEWDTAVSGSSW